MKKAILLLSFFIFCRLGIAATVELPTEAKFKLPELKGLSAQWALAPTQSPKSVKDAYFAIRPNGSLVFSLSHRVFSVPASGGIFLLTDRPFDEFFWTRTGAQLVHSKTALGVFQPSPTAGPVTKGKPDLLFKPILEVPYSRWTVFPGAETDIYVLGYDSSKKKNEISIVGPNQKKGAKNFRKIYSTDAEINSVAGQDQNIYFASGRAIFRISPKKKGAEPIFVHPSAEIREIASLPPPRLGLVYATETSVGYVGERDAFDFLSYPHCQIRMNGDTLYVLLGDLSHGVLRISGMKQFSEYRR